MVNIGLLYAITRGLIDNLLCSFSEFWIIYSESLILKYEYGNFQTYFLSFLVKEK